jgi:hypothetical protein
MNHVIEYRLDAFHETYALVIAVRSKDIYLSSNNETLIPPAMAFPTIFQIRDERVGQAILAAARPPVQISRLPRLEPMRRPLFLDCNFSFAHARNLPTTP